VGDRIFKKWGTTGVQTVLNTAFFELLKMITVYPVENVEKLCDHDDRVLPDAFLVHYGTTAKQFAYLIHSDLGEGFIYAIDARTRRRLGEDYVLKDRDVVKIVSAKSRR
jgi:ribosome-binding ATPase YchF (GTP1/OBG family)